MDLYFAILAILAKIYAWLIFTLVKVTLSPTICQILVQPIYHHSHLGASVKLVSFKGFSVLWLLHTHHWIPGHTVNPHSFIIHFTHGYEMPCVRRICYLLYRHLWAKAFINLTVSVPRAVKVPQGKGAWSWQPLRGRGGKSTHRVLQGWGPP